MLRNKSFFGGISSLRVVPFQNAITIYMLMMMLLWGAFRRFLAILWDFVLVIHKYPLLVIDPYE